jgi:hypothetical protein
MDTFSASTGGSRAYSIGVLACARCWRLCGPTRVVDSDSTLDELRAQNKGMILFDTPLHCSELNAVVGHPDAEGHYVAGETIDLVSIYYLNGEPSQVVLPAGDYGLVLISCPWGRTTQNFSAREIKRGIPLLGGHSVYEQPIVKFSVEPGEIVDIGSLNLPNSSGFFGFGRSFGAYVRPISEAKLQAFASHKPNLYAHLIHRPMTRPDQAQQPRAATSSRH